jgi:hypothetical protein
VPRAPWRARGGGEGSAAATATATAICGAGRALLCAQGKHGSVRPSGQMVDAARFPSNSGFQNAGPKS